MLAEVSAHLESPHQSAVFSELPLLLCTRTRELIRQENAREPFHEGKRDHNCDSCSESFRKAGELIIHMHTIHKGHKDHKCESCGKSFSEVGSLKKHIYTIHEGHKDHKCESCGKSFTQSCHLNSHISMVHKCELCGKLFTNLKDHSCSS